MVGLVEKPLLRAVMRETKGNQVRAAQILGINRNTLRKKLKEHGIDPDAALASHGVCHECLALPVGERKSLAEKAITDEQDEYRRELIKDALNKNRN